MFIARARYKAEEFDHVVVRCEEPYTYLYQDFANEIITYPTKNGHRDRWLYNGECPRYTDSVKAIHDRLKKEYGKVKLFFPTEDRCKRPEAKWFKYGQEPATEDYDAVHSDIIIHARNLGKVRYDKINKINRNWPREKWEVFAKASNVHKEVFCIGTTTGSIAVPGAHDHRGIELKELCNYLAHAKVVVGESSGPMHLAMLCGTPIVTWTHNIKEKSLNGHTNKWRYNEMCNPFKVPCTILTKHGWNPTVQEVVEATEKYPK